MGGRARGELPAGLVQGRSRFAAWRGRRKSGERIPAALWTLAVRLAGEYGVSRTATALRLDYHSLKQRTEAAVPAPQSCRPAFVEWPAPALMGKHCQCEWDNGAGVTLRVQLAGYEAADLEALLRGLWSAR